MDRKLQFRDTIVSFYPFRLYRVPFKISPSNSNKKTMKLRLVSLLLALCSALVLHSQTVHPDLTIGLWPDGAPTSNGDMEPEKDYGTHFEHTSDPNISVYLPEHPCGLAVLAIPGGGYSSVWYNHEGHLPADWYNSQGITYAVLKYRLPNGHPEVPLDDVQQAMRIMRQHSAEWGFEKLGVQGCSAGGHLAATAATHYTDPADRPDFQILFYPVISLDPSYTHAPSSQFLLGDKPSKKLLQLYCNELQVTADTPPAFILASTDDGLVPVRNSIEYCNALTAHGVSSTMHLYPVGGHGWCWRDNFPYKTQYVSELGRWLRTLMPQRRVLYIGDSITDGGWGRSGGDMRPSSERSEWDKNHVYGHGYMEQCASYFESHYPDDEIQFWNRGISGNTLAQMSARWQEDCLNLRPNVVSILIGINDACSFFDRQKDNPSLTFDLKAWENQYRNLLNQTRDSLPGVQLVLCTPFIARAGWVAETSNFADRATLMRQMADVVRKLADEFQATLVPFDTLFQDLRTNHPTSNNSYWIWDGIHPTPAGHRKMSDLWIEKAGCCIIPE